MRQATSPNPASMSVEITRSRRRQVRHQLVSGALMQDRLRLTMLGLCFEWRDGHV